jgi:glycopeptide antibiotics resistance protein
VTAEPARFSRGRRRHLVVALLVVYVVAAALIAFWPHPVDSTAGWVFHAIEQRLGWATHSRLEKLANVVYFVPLGLLLTLLLDRASHVVLPIILVATVLIEAVQGGLLAQRTASIYDIVMNVTGGCVGIITATLITAARARSTGKAARLPG